MQDGFQFNLSDDLTEEKKTGCEEWTCYQLQVS